MESGDNHDPALDGGCRIAALETFLAPEALKLAVCRVLAVTRVRKASPTAARHSQHVHSVFLFGNQKKKERKVE